MEAMVGGTEPAGAATTTLAVAEIASVVAVIVVVPAEIAVSRPFPSIVATRVALDAHVTTRPVSTLPLLSFAVALNAAVCPAVTPFAGAMMLTLATATGTT